MRLAVQAGIVCLTNHKQNLLDTEYDNLQKYLHGDKSVRLYSANKQQAERFYKKVKKDKEYPLSLRKDLINVQKAKEFWFLKIPVVGQRGGVRVPIIPHRDFPDEYEICETKVVKKKGKYIAYIVIEIPDVPLRRTENILAIDLGERYPATAVLLKDGKVSWVSFYGKEVRGIRRHYAWLRKRLQERDLTEVVKRIGAKEAKRINDILHKVSKDIVEKAFLTNSCIVLGSLKGIRERVKGRGKRFNRIVSNMPYYKLSKMIEYKAEIKGIPVIYVSEAYTSQNCHVCHNKGNRKGQGYFICPCCGWQGNADYNGAYNIGKKLERSLGYMPFDGASCEHALTGIKVQSDLKLSAKAESGSPTSRLSPGGRLYYDCKD